MSRVTLVGKPGCHLCDAARDVVATECAAAGADWSEVSILSDPELADRYWELIPVVLVDGVEVAHWFITGPLLRAALANNVSK